MDSVVKDVFDSLLDISFSTAAAMNDSPVKRFNYLWPSIADCVIMIVATGFKTQAGECAYVPQDRRRADVDV